MHGLYFEPSVVSANSWYKLGENTVCAFTGVIIINLKLLYQAQKQLKRLVYCAWGERKRETDKDRETDVTSSLSR